MSFHVLARYFLFLLSCVPLAAVSLPPFPTRFSSVRLYVCSRCIAVSPTVCSTLSSLILGSYQGGDTFLQEAVLMMLCGSSKAVAVNSSAKLLQGTAEAWADVPLLPSLRCVSRERVGKEGRYG